MSIPKEDGLPDIDADDFQNQEGQNSLMRLNSDFNLNSQQFSFNRQPYEMSLLNPDFASQSLQSQVSKVKSNQTNQNEGSDSLNNRESEPSEASFHLKNNVVYFSQSNQNGNLVNTPAANDSLGKHSGHFFNINQSPGFLQNSIDREKNSYKADSKTKDEAKKLLMQKLGQKRDQFSYSPNQQVNSEKIEPKKSPKQSIIPTEPDFRGSQIDFTKTYMSELREGEDFDEDEGPPEPDALAITIKKGNNKMFLVEPEDQENSLIQTEGELSKPKKNNNQKLISQKEFKTEDGAKNKVAKIQKLELPKQTTPAGTSFISPNQRNLKTPLLQTLANKVPPQTEWKNQFQQNAKKFNGAPIKIKASNIKTATQPFTSPQPMSRVLKAEPLTSGGVAGHFKRKVVNKMQPLDQPSKEDLQKKLLKFKHVKTERKNNTVSQSMDLNAQVPMHVSFNQIVNKEFINNFRPGLLRQNNDEDLLKRTPSPFEEKDAVFQSAAENEEEISSALPPIEISSLQQLFSIFQINLKPDNSFYFKGESYKINMNELIKNTSLIRKTSIRRRNSSKSVQHQTLRFEPAPSSEVDANICGLDIEVQSSEPQVDFLKAHTPSHVHKISAPTYNTLLPSINLNSKSQNNLNLPPSGQFSNHLKQNNMKSQRSAISNKSGIRSNNSHRDKSPIVSQHELQAQRLRSRSKNKSGRGASRSNAINCGLQIERQNITDISAMKAPDLMLKNPTIHNSQQLFKLPHSSTHYMMNMTKNNLLASENTNSGQLSSFQTSNQYQSHQMHGKTNNMSEDCNQAAAIRANLGSPGLAPEIIDCLSDKMLGAGVGNVCLEETGPEQIHLAFLFASPLMLQTMMIKTGESQYYDVLSAISFSEEFAQIKDMLEEKQIAVNYRYMVATERNLLTALRENPVGLHFSGHGFRNEKIGDMDKKAKMWYKNKGDVLIFENENGASELFFTSDLKKMFEEIRISKEQRRMNFFQSSVNTAAGLDLTTLEGPSSQQADLKYTDLEFVYVASCHSEQVGQIFIEAGVPHVICIDQKETIPDKAASEFSKYFYLEVFDDNYNICMAYELAQSKVEKSYGKFQAQKIKLLKNESTHGCQCIKDKRLKKRIGQLRQVGEVVELKFLPNKVTPFLSRTQDMFEVLKLLSSDNNSIVQIWGIPGLGKSALLKNVTFHLGERDIYKGGILYIDFTHVKTFSEIVQIMNAYLKDVEYDDLENIMDDMDNEEIDFEQEILKARISRLGRKFLFSLDNVDYLIAENHDQFLTFLTEITNESIKVLFTSNKYDSKHSHHLDSGRFIIKKIQKLKQKESYELFEKKIPLSEEQVKQFLSWDNIQELHQVTLKRYGTTAEFIPKICAKNHTHGSTCVQEYLVGHPFFEFLTGNPLVITIVAALSVCKSLSELFSYLAEKNENNFQSEVLKARMDAESLIHCLEYCTKHFTSLEDGSILELWYMIGTQGPGILKDDLKEIMDKYQQVEMSQGINATQNEEGEQVKVQKLDRDIDQLLQFSLIEQEELRDDKVGGVHRKTFAYRYKVAPFVDQYIAKKMSFQMKQDHLECVCTHLKEKLKIFKEQYALEIVACVSRSEVVQQEQKLQEKIRFYEQQIMHIVYSLFKLETCARESETNETDLLSDDNILSDEQINAKRTGTGTLPKQARPASRGSKQELAPQVSEMVKFHRSTFAIKSPEQLKQFQNQISDKNRQTEARKRPSKPVDVIASVREEESSQSNQTILKERDQDLFVAAKELHKSQDKGVRKLSGNFDENKTDRSDNLSNRKRSHRAHHAKDPAPKLGFVNQKESFKKDLKRSAGDSDDKNISSPSKINEDQSAVFARDLGQQSQQDYNLQDFLKERDMSYAIQQPLAEKTDLVLESQRSSEDGPFEKNIGLIAMAKMINPKVKNLEEYQYDEDLRRSSTMKRPGLEMESQTRQQTKMLKRLETLAYDDTIGVFNKIRNSSIDYKKSSTQTTQSMLKALQAFQNPESNKIATNLEKPWHQLNLQPIPENFVNQSAPPKLSSCLDSVSQSSKVIIHQLSPCEELFYHYLSILALLPDRRQDFLQILDTYGQREKNNNSSSFKQNGNNNQFVSGTGKPIQEYKPLVEIPAEAVLLKANTQMLELYVLLSQEAKQYLIRPELKTPKPNRAIKYDSIFEKSNEVRVFFDSINFKRGLAMVDYIQAQRVHKIFKKMHEFKVLIKQSAQRFYDCYDLDGVTQCSQLASKVLKTQSGQDIGKIKSNNLLIDDLETMQKKLENTQDELVKELRDSRKKMILANLSSKLIVVTQNSNLNSDSQSNLLSQKSEKLYKITCDLVHNMLLSPQMQHSS